MRPGFGMRRNGSPVEDAGEPLPPGARVDLARERDDSQAGAVLDALDADLVGLAPVKTRIREIAALLLVDRVRARFGID